MIALTRLDHLVLTVRDVAATCRFYERVLGMEVRTFGEGRVALHLGDQKINLHDAATPIDPNVRHAAPGSADLCFLSGTPMPEVLAHLAACGVPVLEGVGRRTQTMLPRGTKVRCGDVRGHGHRVRLPSVVTLAATVNE